MVTGTTENDTQVHQALLHPLEGTAKAIDMKNGIKDQGQDHVLALDMTTGIDMETIIPTKTREKAIPDLTRDAGTTTEKLVLLSPGESIKERKIKSIITTGMNKETKIVLNGNLKPALIEKSLLKKRDGKAQLPQKVLFLLNESIVEKSAKHMKSFSNQRKNKSEKLAVMKAGTKTRTVDIKRVTKDRKEKGIIASMIKVKINWIVVDSILRKVHSLNLKMFEWQCPLLLHLLNMAFQDNIQNQSPTKTIENTVKKIDHIEMSCQKNLSIMSLKSLTTSGRSTDIIQLLTASKTKLVGFHQ